MTTRAKVILAAMLLASTAAACVSAPEGAPKWSEQAASSRGGYPDLHDVPRTSIANTDAAHWAEVEADVVAAGAAMKANPRSEPAAPAQ